MTFSFSHLLGVAAGGALGASLRYLFVVFVQGGAFGILVLNVVGSLLLGILFFSIGEKAPGLTAFASAGVLGALTTYSTFSGDVVRLFGQGPGLAAGYVMASLVLGVLAFAGGAWIGRAL